MPSQAQSLAGKLERMYHMRMAQAMEWRWPLITILIVLYVLSCVRVALHARRSGRNGWAWFLITLFLTAIPAAIVFTVDYRRQRRRQMAETLSRCARCGRLIDPSELPPGPIRTCPHCGMQLDDQTRLA